MTRQVYIILFRGVGGNTQLPVKALKAAVEADGFERVSTYINSGNLVLASDASREETVKRIARVVGKDFGFHKTIFALTRREWGKLIEKNPFPKAVAVPTSLHAAVLAENPSKAAVEAVHAHAVDGEGFEVVGSVAYLHTPHGFGRSKLAERFDKAICVDNTARNWNTVLKLAELAEAADA